MKAGKKRRRQAPGRRYRTAVSDISRAAPPPSPAARMCAMVQSGEFSHSLSTHSPTDRCPTPAPFPQCPALYSCPAGQPSTTHTALGGGGEAGVGVCAALLALLTTFLHVQKDLRKNSQPSVPLISYICFLITASLRLLTGSRGEEEELGRREALHIQPKARAARGAASLPHQMTRPDLAAKQVQLSRHSLICRPLQERTFVPSLQTRAHTEDTYYRTFLHELGFAFRPSVTSVLGLLAFHTEMICQAAVHHCCLHPVQVGVL